MAESYPPGPAAPPPGPAAPPPRQPLDLAEGSWRHDPAPSGQVAGIAALGAPLVGLLLLLAFGAWTDSLAALMPGLARNGAPVGLYLGVVAILAGAGFALGGVAHGEAYVATLWATLPFVPSMAAIAIVLAYLATSGGQPLHHEAVLFGAALAGAGWIVASAPLRGLASADIAQSRSFEELRERTQAVTELAATCLSELPAGQSDRSCLDVRASLRARLGVLRRELGFAGRPGAGLRYVSASGYINLWRTLHAAEEAIIALESSSDVIADAAYDDLRLAGSNMSNGATLRTILRAAVATIDPHAAGGYLPRLASGVPEPGGAPSAAQAPEPPVTDADRATARAVMAEIRRSINEYRDSRWDGLVRERNRLLRTVLLSSIVVLLLVGLGVALDVGSTPIASASAFFLVGAAVGLFARLRIEGATETAVDDYGLFEARLLHAPLLSGLAAVGGVFLGAALPTVSGGDVGRLDLFRVFDLAANGRALVTAGIFGLAPELLVASVRKQVDAIKSDLNSSQAAGDSSSSNHGTSAPRPG